MCELPIHAFLTLFSRHSHEDSSLANSGMEGIRRSIPFHLIRVRCSRTASPTCQGFCKYKDAARSVSNVFAICPTRLGYLHRNRFASFIQQLVRLIIHAHHRTVGVIRQLIDVQHIFHGGNKRRVLLRQDTPLRPSGRSHGKCFRCNSAQPPDWRADPKSSGFFHPVLRCN